jgi:hypothetical protein
MNLKADDTLYIVHLPVQQWGYCGINNKKKVNGENIMISVVFGRINRGLYINKGGVR